MRISDWSSDVCSSDLRTAGELGPFLLDVEVDQVDVRRLQLQGGIGRFPELDRVGAIGQRIADQARCRGVDRRDLAGLEALPAGQPFKPGIAGGAACGRQRLACQIGYRLDLRFSWYDRRSEAHTSAPQSLK